MVVLDLTFILSVFRWKVFFDVQVTYQNGILIGIGLWTESSDEDRASGSATN